MQGKVASALRWLDIKCKANSLQVDNTIIDLLKQKHPDTGECKNTDLLKGPINKVESVLFDMIDADCIKKAAITTKAKRIWRPHTCR